MTNGTGQQRHLHHLALGARDVAKLASFYASAFDLGELARHHCEDGELRSVWLDVGGAVLMIEHTKREREPKQGVDAGLFLMAFRIEQQEHAAFEHHLAELGCPRESRTEHTSYFRDPEGNRFAVSSYPFV